MTRQLLLLSTIALLLVGLWAIRNGSHSDASVPAPVRYEYDLTEGDTQDITLAASHFDGLPGCTELDFTVANVTGGALEDLTDIACAPGAILTNNINETDASLPVVTTTGFPSAGSLRIDDEIVLYSSKTDTAFNGAIRATANTNAAPHDEGATVSQAEMQNARLDENHSDADTTIVLDGISHGFPSEGVVQVNDEWITYTSAAEVAGTTTELGGAVRGAFNTTASAYSCMANPCEWIAYLAPSVSTNLVADIGAPSAVIPVGSVAGFAAPDGHVQIGEEVIAYTAVGTTAEDCNPAPEPCLAGAVRGFGASGAAAHSTGDTVFQVSAVDTDAATTTFAPGAEYFGLSAQLSDDIPDTAILVPATASAGALATAFPGNGTLAVDDEVFSYTAVETESANCDPLPASCFSGVTRGVGGTGAAAHFTGATIYQAFFTYTVAHNPAAGPIVIGVSVTPENDPPVTEDHEANLADSSQTLELLVVAEDVDGDSGEHAEGDCELGFTVDAEPPHGTLEAIQNHECTSVPPNSDDTPNEDSATVRYMPNDGFEGEDFFVIRVCDDDSCATSSTTVTVGNFTPAPTPSPTPSPTPTPPPAPTPLPWDFGDIDCDGDVDAVDALAILLVLAGFDPIDSDDPDCPLPGDGPPTPAPTPPPTPTPTPTPEPADTPTPAPVT